MMSDDDTNNGCRCHELKIEIFHRQRNWIRRRPPRCRIPLTTADRTHRICVDKSNKKFSRLIRDIRAAAAMCGAVRVELLVCRSSPKTIFIFLYYLFIFVLKTNIGRNAWWRTKKKVLWCLCVWRLAQQQFHSPKSRTEISHLHTII